MAARAIADAAPNPPVGCVLVRDGATLGEGWHHRPGEGHAEVEALRDARTRGLDPRGATAYVSLEPCNHHGRTPPCTAALIDAGVARVVIGAMDPNPQTSGGGVRRLREAGIDVEVIDDAQARALIERFRFTIASPLPYVTLKMAMSLDGCVTSRAGVREWLTGAESRTRVHALRAEYDAVMVGAGTIRVDDSLLTTRPHATRRAPYVRIVVCERDPIPLESRVLAEPDDAPPGAYARTVLLAPAGARARFAPLEARADVVYVGEDDVLDLDLTAAMRALRERGVSSVFCEGGPTLAGRLIAANLVERALFFIAPRFLRGPDAVPVLTGAELAATAGWRIAGSEPVGEDLLLTLSREA